MAGIIIIIDSGLVGLIVAFIFDILLGNKPLARLLRLILGVVSGFAYFYLLGAVNIGEIEVKDITAKILFFGPIVLLVVLLILAYMFKDYAEKQDTDKNDKTQ